MRDIILTHYIEQLERRENERYLESVFQKQDETKKVVRVYVESHYKTEIWYIECDKYGYPKERAITFNHLYSQLPKRDMTGYSPSDTVVSHGVSECLVIDQPLGHTQVPSDDGWFQTYILARKGRYVEKHLITKEDMDVSMLLRTANEVIQKRNEKVTNGAKEGAEFIGNL